VAVVKSTRIAALGLLAAGALAAAACSFPPYDEGLSLGVLTARKMDPVGHVGPLNIWWEDYEGRDTYFLLSKSDLIAGLPLRGYFLGLGNYNVRLEAVEYNGTDHYVSQNRWEDVDNTDPNRLALNMDVAPGSDAFYAYALQDEGRYLISRDLIETYDGEDTLDLDALISADFPGAYSPQVVGVTVMPTTNSTQDEVLILWRDSATRDYHEARYRTTAPPTTPTLALGAPSELRLSGFTGLPSGTQPGYYGHHAASGRSYFSFYDTSEKKYRTFRWDDSLNPVELKEMKHRVDKVLSNGLLFSYGETMGFVYDAGGVRVNRFPLGDLHLSCEIDIGTPRLYFTLPSWGRSGDSNDEFLLVLVYSIPTSEIDEL
jgi:hypothetical protein